MCTGIFELPRLPHAFFNFADLLLIQKEEARRLVEPRNLSSEGKVMDMLQRVVETRFFINAVLELPEVVGCIPWPFSHIVTGECIQGSPILIAVSRNNTYDMGIRAPDNPSIARRNAPPLAVGDDTGTKLALQLKLNPSGGGVSALLGGQGDNSSAPMRTPVGTDCTPPPM